MASSASPPGAISSCTLRVPSESSVNNPTESSSSTAPATAVTSTLSVNSLTPATSRAPAMTISPAANAAKRYRPSASVAVTSAASTSCGERRARRSPRQEPRCCHGPHRLSPPPAPVRCRRGSPTSPPVVPRRRGRRRAAAKRSGRPARPLVRVARRRPGRWSCESPNRLARSPIRRRCHPIGWSSCWRGRRSTAGRTPRGRRRRRRGPRHHQAEAPAPGRSQTGIPSTRAAGSALQTRRGGDRARFELDFSPSLVLPRSTGRTCIAELT